MAINRVVVLASLALILGSCDSMRWDPVGDIETRAYTITYIDPPKHVWATLVDNKTGETYPEVWVGKHCNRWQEVVVPSTVVLGRQTYRRRSDGRTTTDFVNARTICPGG